MKKKFIITFIFKIPAVPVNCTKISMIKNYTHTHLLWFRIRLSLSLYFSTVHSKHRETIRQRENYRNDAYNLKKQQPVDPPKIYFHYLCTTQVLLELSYIALLTVLFLIFELKIIIINSSSSFFSSIVFVNIPKK